MSFSTLIDALFLSVSSKSGGTADPRVRTILVGTDEMAQLAADGFKQAQYGGFNVPLFNSLEAGIAYARAELAKLDQKIST